MTLDELKALRGKTFADLLENGTKVDRRYYVSEAYDEAELEMFRAYGKHLLSSINKKINALLVVSRPGVKKAMDSALKELL